MQRWLDHEGRLVATGGRRRGSWWMHWRGLATFRFGETGGVVPSRPGELPRASCDIFIRGVVPVVILARGLEGLHAGAILEPGGVIGLCATSGTGKSTIALAVALWCRALRRRHADLPGHGATPSLQTALPRPPRCLGTSSPGVAPVLRVSRHRCRARQPSTGSITSCAMSSSTPAAPPSRPCRRQAVRSPAHARASLRDGDRGSPPGLHRESDDARPQRRRVRVPLRAGSPGAALARRLAPHTRREGLTRGLPASALGSGSGRRCWAASSRSCRSRRWCAWPGYRRADTPRAACTAR